MDEIQKLYDALSKRGYYTKSFDDFKVQFQDKAYQDKVYNVVSRDGLYTKSKDEFLSKYSVSPQKDTFKKKEDSEVALETGGEVGTSEPPLRKEKVLDYLAALKTPAVVTGKAPTIISKEEAILPIQKPKKIDTSFGLTKEKIKVDISPKVEEISLDVDPIGLAQRKASETKNLQEATDYLSAAEVFKQLSVPSGYQAYVRSASPLIDKGTATGSVILERGGRYGATTEGLRQIKAPDLSTANEEFIRQNIIPQIERAAVLYKVRANPSFEKELKAANTSVDDPNLRNVLGSAKMGSIMEEFLDNPDVASFAKEENPNLSVALQYAKDKNFELNKEWGISSVANKVSREFERSEKRGGAFAPFATESLKKDIDEVAKQKLNPEEYGIYQTYIKGNEEQYLDTPSFLGGVAEGGKGVFEGILNTIEKVTGFAPPKEDIIRNKWREEAMNVSANPEGLRNIVAESGKVAGLVGALYGTGGLIRGGLGIPAAGTGLPATTLTNIADATNVATAFLGDMIDEGVVKYPTEPVKAYTSAIFNTLVFMAMGKDIFPGAKVKSAFSKVQPEVEQVVKNLANGSISREAARQELNTIGKRAIDIAAAGASQNAKISAELTGLGVLNEGLDILMDMDEDKLRKYYPEGVHGDTFKTMFLSNALVSSIAGYGKVKRDNTIARESIYEAASNPKRYSRIIEDLVIKDPNITKEELLNNLSFAVETKRLLDQRGIPVESQKQYLVKALGERVAIAEKEKIADSTLRKEAEDKIKQAQAEKEAILTAPEEVAPEMVQYTMEAPRLAGEPEQISKPIELSIEPQVPAAPEIETKRADIERRRQEELSALIPQQKQAKGKLDFSAAFSGWLGRDLYEKVFNALQKGETTVAGIKEPLIGEAKPYFEKGLIKSAEDVFKYVNGKDINAKYDAELAALGVGEVVPEAVPQVPAAPEITDTEYNEFIDKGIVAPERLNDIAQKVKNQEKLSEREQEIFADKTSDINKIIAGEVTPEAAPEVPAAPKPTEKVSVVDKRTEAKNQLRDAFNDLMNLGVAYDPRSQAEKQVKLTKAIINVIKQEAIVAIKELQKYIKDNLGFDISDVDAKYLLTESKKPEYAIPEPTAGEVPVQPEARVGEEVAAGVPPTEPPKVTPEGEAPREERKRTILNRIIDSPNTPESLKEEIRKKGLSYEPAKQAEATRLANAIIDAVGIDKAVEMADRGEFADVFGGMNTAVLTESASRLTNDPVKQAQVFDILDRASLWKGQDISYLQEFYTKNPLGVVIYQNAQRKESFREWSAQKDKSWQEALDVLKSEVEQLKKELAELRAKPEAEGVKTAKAKAAAARQKRASLIEKYKKNKGGGLTLSAGGLTKEGIEFVGEVAVTYIQEGIANVEVLVQKVLADIKDVMGRDIPELRDQVETITRESFQKRKGQSVIDRIRKKLDGLSNKEKEEVIRKSYKKILDSGGLDFQDFKDIIADVLGRGPLTEEQANKLKELTKTVNNLEVKSLEAQEKRTPQALAEYEKAQKEAAIARRELDRLFNSKPDLMRTITSLMQLNTLGVVSLVANVTYNVANQSLLRFPVGVINSLLDRSVSGVARLTGKRLNPETNILSRQVQREFFSKMALGFKEAGEQLYTGLNRQDYIQKEVYGGQIRPLESMKNLYSFLKGEKKMSLANFVDNTLQATVGVPAEAVARLLSLGDKPFRYAAEGAMAAQISKALGIKGLDYDLFVKFPKAEAYRVYKSQGFSEAEALQKAEIIEKTIIQEGKRSTFQQENFLNDKLSQLFNDTQSGAGAFVKSLTISPYVKIPSNAFWSNFNLLHPEVAMLQMFLLGDKARKLQEKDPVAAKMARRESRYWFSHAVVGFSYLSAITSMVAAGVFTPGVTAEETKKEREGKQYYGKPGTINVMKLMAWLRGEDPTKVKEGYDVQIKWFGHIGYLGNAIARRELDLTEEQRNNRLQFTEFLLSNLTEDALEGLQSGVFSNTSALINALQSDFFLKRYGLNVLGMLTNVIHPASLAQLSRNELPYYSSTKADSFMDEVKNSFMQRSTWVRDLMGVDQKAKEIEKRRNRELSYAATDQEKIKIKSKYDAELFSLQTAKVGIWGDKLEKKDNFMMRWFGISKSNPDNFAQPLYDIVKRTNNISYFPPTIKPEIEDQGKKTDLNVKQTMELEMLVGQYRKNLVAPLLNDSVEIKDYGVWSEIEDNLKSQGLTAEEARVKADDIKLDAIKKAYEIGFEFGKEAFLDEHPEFRNEDYNKSEIQRRKNTMEKLGKELKKQF